VRLHADLTILAKLSCALARARVMPLAGVAHRPRVASPVMTRCRRGLLLALVMMSLTVCACGQTHKPRPLRTPSEAVRILKREGYVVPTLAPAPPGETLGRIEVKFDTRYGQPVAYLYKEDLYVTVARGDSHTPRVPDALWHRFGSTILIGSSSGPSGRAQFQALVEAL
jgi:hypothetical protein